MLFRADFENQTKTSIGTLEQCIEAHEPSLSLQSDYGWGWEEWTQVRENKSGVLAAMLYAEPGIKAWR